MKTEWDVLEALTAARDGMGALALAYLHRLAENDKAGDVPTDERITRIAKYRSDWLSSQNPSETASPS